MRCIYANWANCFNCWIWGDKLKRWIKVLNLLNPLPTLLPVFQAFSLFIFFNPHSIISAQFSQIGYTKVTEAKVWKSLDFGMSILNNPVQCSAIDFEMADIRWGSGFTYFCSSRSCMLCPGWAQKKRGQNTPSSSKSLRPSLSWSGCCLSSIPWPSSTGFTQ